MGILYIYKVLFITRLRSFFLYIINKEFCIISVNGKIICKIENLNDPVNFNVKITYIVCVPL